jgi:hypothetical protein
LFFEHYAVVAFEMASRNSSESEDSFSMVGEDDDDPQQEVVAAVDTLSLKSTRSDSSDGSSYSPPSNSSWSHVNSGEKSSLKSTRSDSSDGSSFYSAPSNGSWSHVSSCERSWLNVEAYDSVDTQEYGLVKTKMITPFDAVTLDDDDTIDDDDQRGLFIQQLSNNDEARPPNPGDPPMAQEEEQLVAMLESASLGLAPSSKSKKYRSEKKLGFRISVEALASSLRTREEKEEFSNNTKKEVGLERTSKYQAPDPGAFRWGSSPPTTPKTKQDQPLVRPRDLRWRRREIESSTDSLSATFSSEQEQACGEVAKKPPADDNETKTDNRDEVEINTATLPALMDHDGLDEEENPAALMPVDDRITRAWGHCALSRTFEPPYDLIHSEGGFEGALAHAKEHNRLLLVSLQEYSEFGCHAVNRDIWGDDLIQDVIRAKFVFWQATVDTREGGQYARHFGVNRFPHIGIIHPNHRSIVWGSDGWTSDKPWTVCSIMEAMTDICFERYTEEQISMELDDDVEPCYNAFCIEPIMDASQVCETQEAIFSGGFDITNPEEVSEFYDLQEAFFQSLLQD